jgi:hypothetical protein
VEASDGPYRREHDRQGQSVAEEGSRRVRLAEPPQYPRTEGDVIEGRAVTSQRRLAVGSPTGVIPHLRGKLGASRIDDLLDRQQVVGFFQDASFLPVKLPAVEKAPS